MLYRGIIKPEAKAFEDYENGYSAGRDAAFSGRYADSRFGPPKYNGKFGEGFADGYARVSK